MNNTGDQPTVKRVVVREPSGLWRILGLVEGQPPDVIAQEGLPYLDLVRVRPRYVLYREPMALQLGKLGEFAPEQR